MAVKVQSWPRVTKAVYVGVMMFSIAGIVNSVFEPFNDGMNTDSGNMLHYILVACMIAGYLLYINGLGRFRTLLDEGDSDAVRKIRNAAILNIVAYLLALFSFMTWAGYILNIIAFFFMMIGFMNLKNSPTFPAGARRGASSLFLSMILGLLGNLVILVLGWIPVIGILGDLIGGIILMVSYVMLFSGWAQIKNANPAVIL